MLKSSAAFAATMKPPNLVFVFSDQQHFRALGSKDPFFQTPNQDAFSATATRFDKVYCPTPLCSPARATLMTGRNPWQHGVTDNGLHLREATLGARLQELSYHTAYFGKWHLGDEPVAIAGWDEKQGVYDEYVKPNRPLDDQETLSFAVEFLSRAPALKKPFALFVSFDEPHGVYWAVPKGPYPAGFMKEPAVDDTIPLPASWAEQKLPDGPPWDTYPMGKQLEYWRALYRDDKAARRYRAIYHACLSRYDRNFGAVMDSLKAGGLFDSALIMATSDHGDMDTAHRLILKGPVPFEEIQRIPLAVKLPAQREGRVETEALVSSADLPATLLDYAGRAGGAEAGFSLRSTLEKTAPHARQEAVSQYPKPQILTLRAERWKYTRFPNGTEWLFDLDADPYEMKNLAARPESKAVLTELSRRLDSARS